ncbi:predicted protein [Naegleria gruberi]|uniref:Predicted protein n=1 Tax=Naegleria gruberi TaxID=5762 RepID=D2VUF4_NAEGR|nr:uncharacterized protein NAEGRDRAFT_72645 [Naegleria gruberi]EFC39506.1 predicted protein [Naegleria gruberi]|eukprot:XP_002672250.1 predicted protein [Naegleria gruberi strain NEG-M]
MSSNRSLSQLLVRLGHTIFEEWDQFCGNEACKKLKNVIGNSIESKTFYKVPIEMQIHWIAEFICDYICYDRVSDRDETFLTAHFLIKVVLRKCVEREISFGKSPLAFDAKVTSSPLIDQSSGGDEQFFYSKLSENIGNSESQMDSHLQEQLHTLLADAFESGGSDEELDENTSNIDPDHQWRILISQVSNELFSEKVESFNSDMNFWNSVLDQILNEGFFENLPKKKIDFTQDQIKKMKKPNSDFVNLAMCRLQFTCQINAKLFQYSFRELSKSYLKDFESVPFNSQEKSNSPNAFSILTVCHWHLQMSNAKSSYSSPLQRLQAFERVQQSANFPITCAAHSIPFENSQFASALASSVKSIKSYFGFH